MTQESSTLLTGSVASVETFEVATHATTVDCSLANVDDPGFFNPSKTNAITYTGTSDESTDPSLDADASHTSTFASIETTATFEDFPFLNKCFNSFSQFVDNIQEGSSCSNLEAPQAKPSLLYRAKCGTSNPAEKLHNRNTSRESYLNRFASRQHHEKQNDPVAIEEDPKVLGKMGRFRNLIHRKTSDPSTKERTNSRRGIPKVRRHRRQKKETREKNGASVTPLTTLLETPRSDLVEQTPKFKNGAQSAWQFSNESQDNNNVILSRSDDELGTFSRLPDADGVIRFAQNDTPMTTVTNEGDYPPLPDAFIQAPTRSPESATEKVLDALPKTPGTTFSTAVPPEDGNTDHTGLIPGSPMNTSPHFPKTFPSKSPRTLSQKLSTRRGRNRVAAS